MDSKETDPEYLKEKAASHIKFKSVSKGAKKGGNNVARLLGIHIPHSFTRE